MVMHESEATTLAQIAQFRAQAASFRATAAQAEAAAAHLEAMLCWQRVQAEAEVQQAVAQAESIVGGTPQGEEMP